MKANFKKLVTLALSIVMLMSFGVLGFAATNDEPSLPDTFALGKTATDFDDDFNSTVTLTVPQAQRELVNDIVLVVDKSTSYRKDAEQTAAKFVRDIRENQDTKVGVIVFEGKATITRELKTFENVKELDEAINGSYESIGGSNIDAGLTAARKMLAADTTVSNDRKYVVLISDGLTRLFCDDDGNPKVIYNEYAALDDGSYFPENYRDKSAYNFSYRHSYDLWTTIRRVENYNIPEGDWNSYMNNFVKSLVEKDGDKYVIDYTGQSYNVEDRDRGEYYYKVERDENNKVKLDENKLPIFLTDENGNRIESIKSNEPEKYIPIPEAKEHATCIERSFYEAIQIANVLKGECNLYAVGNPTSEMGRALINEINGGKSVNLSSIQKEILYSADKGSMVIDRMGYAKDDYDFEFVAPGNIVYGDLTLKPALNEQTGVYEYSDEQGVLYFTLKYIPDEGADERFEWTFNQAVSAVKPAQLSYTVKLKNPKDECGTYTVLTNVSATLYAKDTDGTEYAGKDFPLPTVEYTVEGVDITVEKEWIDDNNRDGLRPDAITIKLVAPEGLYADEKTITLSGRGDKWTGSFENLQKTLNGETIRYTVEEVLEEDSKYESKVELDKETGKFIITNSYTPEEVVISGTKTWDDADDVDGIRPESITVYLMNGEEVVAEATASEETQWTYTFAPVAKFANGVEIVYTVSEEGVEGYDPTVDGFDITNKHEPEPTPEPTPTPTPVPAPEPTPAPPSNGGGVTIVDPPVPLGSSPFKTSNTGDEFNGMFYALALGVSMAGIAMVVAKKKKGEF